MRHFPGTKAGARMSRYWPAPAAASVAVALAATMTAAASAAAGTAADSAKAQSVTRYAIGKRACPAPPAGAHGDLLREIRKVVKKGTKGARPFKVAAAQRQLGLVGRREPRRGSGALGVPGLQDHPG